MSSLSYSKLPGPFHLDYILHPRNYVNEHAAIYMTHAMRQFAVSMVGIFLPIYIFEISFTHKFFHAEFVINGLIWVLLYFMLRSLGTVLWTVVLGGVIFSKLKLNRSIIFSLVVLIGEIAMWYLAKYDLRLILVAGILSGLKVALYWIPYHIFFVRKFHTKSGKFGKETSIRTFFVRLSAVIGPAVGGFIIASFGFGALFIISILVLLLAGFPILLAVSEWKHRDHKIGEVIQNYIFNPKLKEITTSFFGQGLEAAVYQVFWPILMFIIVVNFVKVGVLSSVSMGASMVTALLVGVLLDKYGSKVIHGIGVTVNALFYLPRVIMTSPVFVYILDVADRINSPFYAIPNMTVSYEKAEKLDVSDFIIYRELALHISIAAVSAVLILCVFLFVVWRWVFVLAAIGSLLAYMIDMDKN